MSVNWWAGERVSQPPLVELLSNENRGVSVTVADALVGAEVVNGTPTVSLAHWRTGKSYAEALVGTPLYEPSTKTVTQRVNAAVLPVGEPIAMRITFNVGLAQATDTRGALIVLMVIK